MKLSLICLLAALLATGAGAVCKALKLPDWLGRIVELAVLLLAFVWLQAVL
jgi:hypothetical protein